MSELVVAPLTSSRWPDLETLFRARGGPKHCWCMVWRPLENRGRATPEDRRRALQRLVRAGTTAGLIGYLGGQPVAWCSLAPKASHERLTPGHGEATGLVWSLSCFYVSPSCRGQGISAAMLEAAVAEAMRSGADWLEATPVDPDSPSFGYMGRVGMFAARGFTDLGLAGRRRHVMRLALRPAQDLAMGIPR